MRRCEVCGTSYDGDELICPRCNVALTEVADEPVEEGFRSAYLGRYDEYEADLVVDILQGAGVRAFPKIRRTDPYFSEYGRSFATDLGVVMVDAARLDDARRIVAEELPRQLEAIALEMDALAMGMEEPDDAEEDDG